MSPPLGDQFPEEFREQFASQNLKIGSVIRAFVADTNPPKIKRFIVIGISGDKLALGTLYINTEVNPNIFQTEDLKKLHLKFEVTAERTYLDHDCHVDCSRVYEKEYATIFKLLQTDVSTLIGELNATDLRAVKQKVKGARTISIRIKKKYGLF